MKYIYYTILFLFALTIGSCKRGSSNADVPIFRVKVESPELSSAFVSATYPGVVKSKDNINVSFRVPGKIEKLLVKEGDFVRSGQVIAILDKRDYLLQLEATTAEYNAIKSEVDRVIELYNKGSITPNEYDKAIGGLEQITAKLSLHKNSLKDTELKAPYDGYIDNIFYHSAEIVSAGIPVISIFCKQNREVELLIPYSMFKNLDKYKVSCYSSLFPDSSFELVLESDSKKANIYQLYRVNYRLKDRDQLLWPGLSVTVKFTMLERDSSISNSLYETNSTALVLVENKTGVWVYSNTSEVVQFVPVEVFDIDRGGKAIITGEINENSQIVVAGSRHLYDGAKVKLVPNQLMER